MQAHSHLHPHSHPVPPPHSCAVFSLYPLHGFVLLPQCQGPGDEVTLHRRAAGLTEPRPSPPASSAQRTNRPAVSPPPAHYLFLSPDSFTSTPMQTTGHAHKHLICRKFLLARLHSCKLVQINTHIHAHERMHIHTVTHT